MCKAIEDLIADGVEKGKEAGKAEGKKVGRLEGDAARIIKSIEEVMKNLQVSAARACEILGITIEEYQNAKGIQFL